MPGSNTHRAGVSRPSGSPKMIASGSEEFCDGAASRYLEKHPDSTVFVELCTKPGPPVGWNLEEKEETNAQADQ